MKETKQASGLDTLDLAFKQSEARDWLKTQELCAKIAELPPPLGAVARLNILICQYHLGHTQLIPERALPLLAHLPDTGMQTCIGLALLAARKNNTLSDFKHLALALAIPGNEPWDLPTVPMFVMLQSDMNSCMVFESNDCALMSEIVQIILDADEATSEERLKLNSLAKRYRERASLMAASHIASTTGNQIEKPWWKFW